MAAFPRKSKYQVQRDIDASKGGWKNHNKPIWEKEPKFYAWPNRQSGTFFKWRNEPFSSKRPKGLDDHKSEWLHSSSLGYIKLFHNANTNAYS